MPCMCGATDCPSCGPDQGYRVVKVWSYRRNCYEWINPDDDLEDDDYDDEPPDENNTAEDAAEE